MSLNSLPSKLFAGDSAVWVETATHEGIDTEAEFEAAYVAENLKSGDRVRIPGEVAGDEVTYALTAEESSHLRAGEYHLLRVYRQGTSRYTERTGSRIQVQADPEAERQKSHAEKMVHACEAELERRATGNAPFVESSTVSGVEIDLLPSSELEQLLRKYRWELFREKDARRVRAGKKSRNNIQFRF